MRAGLAILAAVGTLKVVFRHAPSGTRRHRHGASCRRRADGDRRRHCQRVAIGETPNLAARLQAVASPGEVVIAASTRRLVGRMFDCRALGANEVKGLPQPVEAWQVRGEAAGVSRFEARRAGTLSPLVGRQEEIELLLRRWDQAKLGEGRVVLLSGEPGIGKSRIAESLLAGSRVSRMRACAISALPTIRNSPLYPFIAQLERAAGFEPGNSAAAKLDKLEALLKPTARNAPRDLALMADLLSMPTDESLPGGGGQSAAEAGDDPHGSSAPAGRHGGAEPRADRVRGRPLDRPDIAGPARSNG